MNPGDLVFQPLAMDLKSGCIALHELSLLHRPRFAHCGVFVGNGEMITASGTVRLQDAGATGNIAIPFAWTNWDVSGAWLRAQIGKPYDWRAWILSALEPLTRWLAHPAIPQDTFTCSSLVATALIRQDAARFSSLNRRTVTPDDIATALGVR